MRSCRAAAVICPLLALVTSLVLAGCSPATSGLTGLTVTDQGSLMGLIKGCAEPISDAYLDIESDDPVNLGHWQPKDASNAPPALALTGQLEGWTALDAWDGKVDARLALVGYAIDQSSYTRPVTFDRQDIESLTPGQILTGDGVMTSGQFDRLCQDR